MTAIDTIARKQAAKAINKYGKSATFNKVVAGAYDPATSSTATGTTTAYSVKVIIEKFSERNINGTLIQAGDLRVSMPALNNQVPEVGDELVVDSKTYRVVSPSESVYSGEQVALYVFQVRA